MIDSRFLQGSEPFKCAGRKTHNLSLGVRSAIILASFIFGFTLLYAEDRLFLFGTSLSNLWKFTLVSASLLFVIIKFQKRMPRFYLMSLVVAMSLAFNGNLLFSIDDAEHIMLFLVLPLSYYCFYFYGVNNQKKLKFNLICLSSFFIVSTIPFILNWVQPAEGISNGLISFAESYKLKSNMLIGFYKHPAISSKVFVLSIAVIFCLGIMEGGISTFNKVWLILIFFIGLYCLYLSFTRTGWLMMALFFGWYIFKDKSLSVSKKFIGVIIILSIFVLLLNYNEAFYSRIFGIREGAVASASIITNLSSGRDIIFFKILALIFGGDNFTLYLGLGSEIYNELNFGGAAHNVFLEYFVIGGLVTLVLFVFWYFMFYRELSKYSNNGRISPAIFALFYISLVGSLISHGFGFYGSILFGGLIAYHRIVGQNIIKE
jgi:hypothetical protein